MGRSVAVRPASIAVCLVLALLARFASAGHYELRPFPPKNPSGGTAWLNGSSWPYEPSGAWYGAAVAGPGGGASATGTVQTVYE